MKFYIAKRARSMLFVGSFVKGGKWRLSCGRRAGRSILPTAFPVCSGVTVEFDHACEHRVKSAGTGKESNLGAGEGAAIVTVS